MRVGRGGVVLVGLREHHRDALQHRADHLRLAVIQQAHPRGQHLAGRHAAAGALHHQLQRGHRDHREVRQGRQAYEGKVKQEKD